MPLRRTASLPSSPSLPSTGASTHTLFNSPNGSEASSPVLFNIRQTLDGQRGPDKECHEALAEYVKGEEKEREDTDWAALVAWMKVNHQAEVILLEKDHAAKVEQLLQERSEVRRRLELRNRELRATKREMKDLKRSIEESTKDKEEIQPAPTPQSADESDAESVDEDEGGVSLANNDGPTCDAPQEEVGEAGRGKGVAKRITKQAKTLEKEAVEIKNNLQQALKQELMEGSVPDALEEVEAGPSAAKEKMREGDSSQNANTNEGHNRATFTEIEDLQDHNRGLKANLESTREIIHNMQMEAELADEEIKKLKAENHFAQLEVGQCNAANAGYRAAAEDDNPARTAHLDDLLKRKDEAYFELEARAAECYEALAEEKRRRAVEKVYWEGKNQGLRNELAHRINMNQALTDGKSILKGQNDEVYKMFESKICQNDMIKALLSDYHAIQKDNALLTNMINERKSYLLAAEKQIPDLKVENINDDRVAESALQHHRQTQQSLNGLMYINHQLTAKVDIQVEMREEMHADLSAQLAQKNHELHQTIHHGADHFLLQHVQAQEAQLASLNDELGKLNRLANHWRMRALEQQDDFCPLFHGAEVADWGAEDARWRLHAAEREVARLQEVIREGKGKGKEVLEVGHDGSEWLKGRAEAARERERLERVV